MKQKWQVVAAAVLVIAAQASMVSAAFAGQAWSQRSVDPATGAEIRLFPGERPGKDVRVEIKDPSVLIRKELTNGTSVTTIVAGNERISLTVGRAGLVVTKGNERVIVERGRADRLEAVRALVATSSAVARATRLLGRLAERPESPLRHTAQVTRAMLLSAAGDASGARELSKWARAARERVSVKPMSLEEGPGECWYLYAVEAIAIYMEYEDCMNQQAWYDLLGMIECAFIYDLRAIGAFSWWVTCVGLRGAI